MISRTMIGNEDMLTAAGTEVVEVERNGQTVPITPINAETLQSMEGKGTISENIVAIETKAISTDAAIEANTDNIAALAGASGEIGNPTLDLALLPTNLPLPFSVIVPSNDTNLLDFHSDAGLDLMEFKVAQRYALNSTFEIYCDTNTIGTLTIELVALSSGVTVKTVTKELNITKGVSVEFSSLLLIDNTGPESYHVRARCSVVGYSIRDTGSTITVGSASTNSDPNAVAILTESQVHLIGVGQAYPTYSEAITALKHKYVQGTDEAGALTSITLKPVDLTATITDQIVVDTDLSLFILGEELAFADWNIDVSVASSVAGEAFMLVKAGGISPKLVGSFLTTSSFTLVDKLGTLLVAEAKVAMTAGAGPGVKSEGTIVGDQLFVLLVGASGTAMEVSGTVQLTRLQISGLSLLGLEATNAHLEIGTLHIRGVQAAAIFKGCLVTIELSDVEFATNGLVFKHSSCIAQRFFFSVWTVTTTTNVLVVEGSSVRVDDLDMDFGMDAGTLVLLSAGGLVTSVTGTWTNLNGASNTTYTATNVTPGTYSADGYTNATRVV